MQNVFYQYFLTTCAARLILNSSSVFSLLHFLKSLHKIMFRKQQHTNPSLVVFLGWVCLSLLRSEAVHTRLKSWFSGDIKSCWHYELCQTALQASRLKTSGLRWRLKEQERCFITPEFGDRLIMFWRYYFFCQSHMYLLCKVTSLHCLILT